MLRRTILLSATLCLSLCLCTAALAQPVATVAQKSAMAPRPIGPTADGHGRGLWLPEYVKDVHPGKPAVQPAPGMEDAPGDPSWDWEALGQCPPVRNQGYSGTCWIHASLGEFESREAILESVSPSSFEYSEQDIGNYYPASHFIAAGTGGNAFMVASYMSKYGSVNEADEPWVLPPTHGTWDPNNTYIKNVENWHFLGDCMSNNAAIKNALTYGPVSTSVHTAQLDAWNASWGTLVAPSSLTGSGTDNDHAVVIVGWDDNKPQTGAATLGAWKVRNSWGSSWGVSGYFWIGYGAAGIGYSSSYFPTTTEQAYVNYNSNMTVLNYDNGWDGGAYSWVSNATTAQMVNKYTIPSLPSGSNVLRAIEVCAMYPNATYTVKVYSGFDGTTLTGELASESGTLSDAGIYCIELDPPLAVSAGQARVLFVDIAYPLPSDIYVLPAPNTSTPQTNKCYARPSSGYGWNNLTGSFELVLRGKIEVLGTPTPTPTATPEPSEVGHWELFE
ncbi:hypothetical protein JW916_16470 [Candidatus Sumerlaeota bacterium]|nr:hypothetical protein [Candidatus Sumerlaeota bacterium]